MKFLAAITLALCLVPCLGRSAELNLATLTCGKYENEVLPAAASNPVADSLNTVMWLFGYSVAKAGGYVMYPEALTAFGFALDGECKSNPAESVLDALAVVKPEPKNPLNLSTLECSTFAPRHIELAHTDPESATTIMMWLFGFSTAKSGSHIFDADLLNSFQSALLADCAKHPDFSLIDALSKAKASKIKPKTDPRSKSSAP
jgi:HdeA/HdeB family